MNLFKKSIVMGAFILSAFSSFASDYDAFICNGPFLDRISQDQQVEVIQIFTPKNYFSYDAQRKAHFMNSRVCNVGCLNAYDSQGRQVFLNGFMPTGSDDENLVILFYRPIGFNAKTEIFLCVKADDTKQ